MSGRKDESAAARKWLDTPEGQKWSRGAHNGFKRGEDIGVFGEVKADNGDVGWGGGRHGGRCIGFTGRVGGKPPEGGKGR